MNIDNRCATGHSVIEVTTKVFRDQEESAVHELIPEIKDDEKHYDDHMARFIRSDEPGTFAAPRAILYRYIKRIWTVLFRKHTAAPEDYALTLWHVPAEKRYGIPWLFEAVRDPASPFWTLPPGPQLAAGPARR